MRYPDPTDSIGRKLMPLPRVLLLYGGWPDHRPEFQAEFAERCLLGKFEVVRAQSLDCLRPDVLAEYDLLVPIWTFGEISGEQEGALLSAVENGLGVLAWHGATSAFLTSRPHKFLLGGQFVAHPGGSEVAYTVRFLRNDPLVEGLEDVEVVSEQYYMLMDPSVKVLATTRIEGAGMDWVEGVEMPVAWTRPWGRGRVFYCALGHTVEVLELDPIAELLRRAALWAVRRPNPRNLSETREAEPAL